MCNRLYTYSRREIYAVFLVHQSIICLIKSNFFVERSTTLKKPVRSTLIAHTPTKANHPTTLHASLFYSPLPQLLRHGKVVFLIPDQPVPLHEGQLIAQRAALHVQVVRQLLAVVGYVEFIAAGALDAL